MDMVFALLIFIHNENSSSEKIGVIMYVHCTAYTSLLELLNLL